MTTVIEAMELDELCIATITAECLKALAYLHSKRIIHRDIKVSKLNTFSVLYIALVSRLLENEK